MYVLLWAYLAYTQFLIIWAADLPREILWYVPRLQTTWRWLGVFLVVSYFCLPLIILLSRAAKRSPRMLGGTAGFVLMVYFADALWLIAPSLRPAGLRIAWTD